MLSSISQYFGFGTSFYSGINKVKDLLEDITEGVNDFCKSCFNSSRKKLSSIVQNSTFNTDLEEYQNERAAKTLKAAVTRNGAKTEKERAQYHQSIEFSKKNTDGIFQYHQASGDKEKKLVIMIMGNRQSLNDSAKQVGMLKIYDQLKAQNKHDLLIMRVGDSKQDLMHKVGMSDNANLNTDVVYQHISNLIEDRCHCRGKFKDSKKPKTIDVIAYSWGAGVQKKLETNWDKVSNKAKARTVSIDGICYGDTQLGDELCKKPNYSSKHLNIYQNNDYLINGEKHQCRSEGDQFINVNEIDASKPGHSEIDDSKVVQKKILSFIN